jgi:hypothetical protein
MPVADIKTDKFGWNYYDHLPDGYRLATLDDFHSKGRKKVGMEYLIQRGDQQYFEIHAIRPETRSITLKPFLDHRMVFVKSE